MDVPKDMTQRAWDYLAAHYRDEWTRESMKDDVRLGVPHLPQLRGLELPGRTWTGGALTPDERKQMLDFSFKHWKEHSPYLKGYWR